MHPVVAPPDGFALPLDHVAGVWWKHAVHRVLIGGKRGTLTSLHFANDGLLIMSGNGISDAHPAAVQRGGESSLAILVPAKTLRVRDQFVGEPFPLTGNFQEQLLHVSGLHMVCRIAETALAVPAGFDEGVQRREEDERLEPLARQLALRSGDAWAADR